LNRTPVIFLLVMILVLLLSCSKNDSQVDGLSVESGWALRHSEREHGLDLGFIENWIVLSETYRNGVLSVELEHFINDESIVLVLTVLPTILTGDELESELQGLLEASLHWINNLEKAGTEDIAGKEVIYLDASAGFRNDLFVRSAGYSSQGKTYIFTLLTGEDVFPDAVIELKQLILASLLQ